MALKQVYNSRSKKWVLYDDSKRSGIINMQAEPYDGVPKNEQPEPVEQPEPEPVEQPEPEPVEQPEPVAVEPVEKPDNKAGGWFDVLGF